MMPTIAMTARPQVGESRPQTRNISLLLAPSNLGLRPTEGGGQPGAWQAPQALMEAGLAQALGVDETVSLESSAYQQEAQFTTKLRNGLSIRAYSLQLGEQVRVTLHAGRFPVVIGGDCSILLGCLYGARLDGGRGLVHIDGHSDFFHPGNYHTAARLGSVAGMDLALASGRGELLLTHWPEVGKPLANDADIIQLGERDADSHVFSESHGDIVRTGITQFTIQRMLAEGIDAVARLVITQLESRGLDKVWLHVDFDVLDESVMPAVDSPGTPGLDYAQLAELVEALCASGRVIGADFTIYDPQLDPFALYSRRLVECVARGVSGYAASHERAS
ncbi:MAG: arginase family protein [Rhodanobacter sp.]